jgi:hypothetical protein
MPLPVNTPLYEDVVCTFMDDVSTAGSALYGPITGADANITVKLKGTAVPNLSWTISNQGQRQQTWTGKKSTTLSSSSRTGLHQRPSYVRRNYHEKLGMRELRQPDQKQRMRSR